MSILHTIAERKRQEVAELRSKISLATMLAQAETAAIRGGFQAALRQAGKVRVIAEFKRASPSKGVIRQDLAPSQVAQLYEQNGAAAMSVLTETHYFQGSPEDLKQVRLNTNLPLLRKDFVISDYQIAEAKVLGADAILLIAALLETAQLKEYLIMAQELELDVLTEVHSQSELEDMLQLGASLIGINNRDLHTFRTSLTVTEKLAQFIPSEVTLVSESGINGRNDLDRLERSGVHAVLVGESIMREANPAAKLKELTA